MPSELAPSEATLGQVGGAGGLARSRIVRTGKGVCGALFFAVFAILVVEVTNRFYDLVDIRWSEEMARTLLVWFVFLGFGLACGADQNVKADLTGNLPEGVLRRLLDGLSIAITFGVLAALLVLGFQLCLIGSNSRMVSLNLSMAFVLASVPVGAGLGAALLIFRAVRWARGRQPPRHRVPVPPS
jgi:C4-dicarboxylate transporter DctQ subunit